MTDDFEIPVEIAEPVDAEEVRQEMLKHLQDRDQSAAVLVEDVGDETRLNMFGETAEDRRSVMSWSLIHIATHLGFDEARRILELGAAYYE